MYAVFCASCGFYIIFNFFLPFGVRFARAWTLACGPRYRSSTVLQSLSAHACALLLPFFPALLPPLHPSLFLQRTFSHLTSSHLISPQTSIINQSTAPCQSTIPTISVLFTHTPRRKVTAFVVSHVSFCVIIAFIVRPVARASFELSTHAFALHHSALITSHTFSRNFHTYKQIHTTVLTSLLPTHPRLYYQ